MAFDFGPSKALADKLIGDFGRAVTLRRSSRTPADLGKPWGARQDDATASDDQAIATTGVFLELERDVPVPDIVEQKRVRVLVPAEPALPEEIGPDWYVTDGIRRWDVVTSKPLQPGPVVLLYELEVRA